MVVVCVVVLAPLGGQELRLRERREILDVEDLVAKPGVEGLDPGVLPRRARVDVGGCGRALLAPVAQDASGQLGAVVGAQVLRRPVLADEAPQDFDRLVGVDRAIDLDRQRLAGELVDDVEELELAAV